MGLDDINIIVRNMHPCIKGHVSKNRDGSHTILINARLNYEQQKEVYEHEINHIVKEDFEKYEVNETESRPL